MKRPVGNSPVWGYDLGSFLANQMRRSFLAVAAGILLLVTAPMQAEELVYARFADYLEALQAAITTAAAVR